MWKTSSPFSFSADALERGYQRQYELPGHAFSISLLVGVVIKLIVLWNTFQEWTAPGALLSMAQGLLALSLCLTLPFVGHFRPYAFKKYWRVSCIQSLFICGCTIVVCGGVALVVLLMTVTLMLMGIMMMMVSSLILSVRLLH